MQTTETPTPQLRSWWQRRRDPPSFRLQERDIEIIRAVFMHRFLQPAHIHALFAGSEENLARRCRLLWQHFYLERPIAARPLKALTEEVVYAVGRKGAALLQHLDPTLRIADLEWTQSPERQIGWPFLDHQLGIATFMVCMRLACKERGIRFVWDGHHNRRKHRLEIGMRRYLQPDAYFVIETPDRRRLHHFLEIDRGNVSLERMRQRYWGYFHWWKRVPEGLKNVRVITVTKSVAHQTALARNSEEVGRSSSHPARWGALIFAHSSQIDLRQFGQVLEVLSVATKSVQPIGEGLVRVQGQPLREHW
jgi:hypothetical protein